MNANLLEPAVHLCSLYQHVQDEVVGLFVQSTLLFVASTIH